MSECHFLVCVFFLKFKSAKNSSTEQLNNVKTFILVPYLYNIAPVHNFVFRVCLDLNCSSHQSHKLSRGGPIPLPAFNFLNAMLMQGPAFTHTSLSIGLPAAICS